MIKYLLRNENYVGNAVYNRQSFRLHIRRVSNPPSEWIRSKGILPAVIDRSTFLRAQRRRTLRWRHLSENELLERLKALLEKEGRLSESLMNRTLEVPAVNVYIDRFGSLRNAYRLIGYRQTWNAEWIDRRDEFNSIIRNAATDLIARCEKAGWVARLETATDVLTLGKRAISLRLARSWRAQNGRLIWTIYSRTIMPKGLILAMRLDEQNREVLDYLLLPTREMTKGKIRFMETGLHRLGVYRHANLASAARAIATERSVRRALSKR